MHVLLVLFAIKIASIIPSYIFLQLNEIYSFENSSGWEQVYYNKKYRLPNKSISDVSKVTHSYPVAL